MIDLTLNGQAHTLPFESPVTLSQVLEHLSIPSARGVAVALNDRVIPKSTWDKTPVHSSDRLEVIRATQGG